MSQLQLQVGLTYFAIVADVLAGLAVNTGSGTRSSVEPINRTLFAKCLVS